MFTASVPASSANLGPGFDTLALALDLRCRVRAEAAGKWSIAHLGPERYEGPPGGDAVLAAARRVCERPLRLEVSNQIPLCSGLGSSAAAYAAGALAGLRAAGEDPDHDRLFSYVKEMEGHPDNAAAAVYGGLVAAVAGSVVRLALSPKLVPVLASPGFELPTDRARSVIPAAVEVEAVVRTVGRVAALVEGLRTGSARLLDLARGDELHEGPRAALNPGVARLMEAAAAAGARYVCWSGAGPSVLALARRGEEKRVAEAVSGSVSGPGGRVLILEPDARGAL